MTPYEAYVAISKATGTLQKVGEKVGKSKAYVSIMRKIHRESSQTLLDYWGIGTIPFDLVRLIVDKPKAEQTWLVLRYLEISTGNNKKERSKARAATLKAIKENSYAQTSQ